MSKNDPKYTQENEDQANLIVANYIIAIGGIALLVFPNSGNVRDYYAVKTGIVVFLAWLLLLVQWKDLRSLLRFQELSYSDRSIRKHKTCSLLGLLFGFVVWIAWLSAIR